MEERQIRASSSASSPDISLRMIRLKQERDDKLRGSFSRALVARAVRLTYSAVAVCDPDPPLQICRFVPARRNKDDDLAVCVAWTHSGSAFLSAGDDRQVFLCPPLSPPVQLPLPFLPSDSPPTVTAVAFLPSLLSKTSVSSTHQNSAQPPPTLDPFATGDSTGRVSLFAPARAASPSALPTVKLEKSVEAHKGAVLALKWNAEGTAFATAGEDGQVKVWSRTGMLRGTVAQAGTPVYALSWSPASTHVAYTSSGAVHVKPLSSASTSTSTSPAPSQLHPLPSTSTSFRAHNGAIVALTWHPVTALIATAGEDGAWKVWDAHGKQMSAGKVAGGARSVEWAPDGRSLAVGGMGWVAVCDVEGYTHHLHSLDTSCTPLSLSFHPSGHLLSLALSTGSVSTFSVSPRGATWRHLTAQASHDGRIEVTDTESGTSEILDFPHPPTHIDLSHNRLAATTCPVDSRGGAVPQLLLFSSGSWTTPAVGDLGVAAKVVGVAQSSDLVAVLDISLGIRLFTTDARPTITIRFPGLRTDMLARGGFTMGGGVIAVRDGGDARMVHLFDAGTGKPLPALQNGGGSVLSLAPQSAGGAQACTYVHAHPVEQIVLPPLPTTPAPIDLSLLVRDVNRAVYLVSLSAPTRGSVKRLGGGADWAAWNADGPEVAVVGEGKLTVWEGTAGVWVNGGDAAGAKAEVDVSQHGRNLSIMSYVGTTATLTRADGAFVHVGNLSPFPAVLTELVAKRRWEDAVRMCRYVKSQTLWSALAPLSFLRLHLATAEVSYAALEDVPTVRLVNRLKELPEAERRAELAVVCGRTGEAVDMLVGMGRATRAVEVWCEMYEWHKALDLALRHNCDAAGVVRARSEYLKATGRTEQDTRFLKAAVELGVVEKEVSKSVRKEEPKEVESVEFDGVVGIVEG